MDSVPDIVDFVLYLLGVLSVMVWSIIIMKSWAWYKSRHESNHFLSEWQQVKTIYELPRLIAKSNSSFARLCNAGMTAMNEAMANSVLRRNERQEVILLSLKQQAYEEHKRMDGGVAVLASIGSTAPLPSSSSAKHRSNKGGRKSDGAPVRCKNISTAMMPLMIIVRVSVSSICSETR